MKRLAGLSHNDQAHRQPERNETMKITDKQVEELGDLFYSISDKKGHHALTPELCDDLIGEVEKILSNSSGCSVEPMVRNASGVASDEQELPKCPICGGILKWDNKVGSDLRETEPNNYYDIKCTTNGCYLEYGADWFHAKDTIIEKLNVRV